jgi:hypothetical protein
MSVGEDYKDVTQVFEAAGRSEHRPLWMLARR